MKRELKMNDLSELYRTENEARLFNELLTYKDTVFWICLGFSKNPHDAEDLTQDVYLKAYLGEQVEKLVTWAKVKKEQGDAITRKVMSALVVEELLSLKKHLDDKAKEKSK